MFSIDAIHLQMLEYLMLGTLSRILTPSCSTADYQLNESTEVQTLGAIRIQLYHQCFEQVWQHNFTSIIGLRRSAHRSSIFESRHIDLRRSTHRSSIFEGRHIDLRRLKAETSHRQPNIAPTFRQFVTEYCPPRRSIIIIPKILRGKTYCIYNIRRSTHAHISGIYGNGPTRH